MSQTRTPSVEFHFGGHVFDVEGFRLLQRGEPLPLQPKVLEALHHFVLNPQVLIRRDALVELLWPDTQVTSNSLEQVIRKLRSALGDTERPHRFIETVARQGYRFVGEVEVQERVRSPRTNLPRDDPGFVGRAEEQAALATLVREHRLVTVVGPGGVGKTRLARHVVARLAHEDDASPDGSWFCALAGATDLRGVLQALEDAVGGFSTLAPTDDAALEQLCGSLADARARLLLDNAEHVVDAVVQVLIALGGRAPDLRVVVTSRRPLHLDRERILHLEPLSPSDGMALLRDRARAARVDPGALSDAQAHTVVDRLQGLPLGIALAAPRLLLVTPEELVRRLDVQLDWLRARTAPDGRHGSLEACFRWSWDLLTPAEQHVLAQCSVFRGGFTLVGAAAVVDPGEAELEVDDVLLSLCDACLIRPLPGSVPPRFDLWETLRPFAQAELAARSGLEAARARLVRFVVDDVGRWIRGTLPERRAGQLERENVWAAWEWAQAPDDVVMCGRILGVIGWAGPSSGLRAVLDRAVETARAAGSEQLPHVLHHRAVFHRIHRSDVAAARQDADALRALAREHDTPALRGNAALAMAFATSDHEACAHLREAVEQLTVARDERYLGVARTRLALNLVDQGAYDEAEGHAQAALDSARARTDARQMMHAMSALSVILLLRKAYEACEALLDEYLALTREVGDRAGENTARLRQAELLYYRGDLARAEAVTREALGTEALQSGRAPLLLRLGAIRREQGALEEALEWLDAAHARCVSATERAYVDEQRSKTLALMGRLDEARAPLPAMLEVCDERSPLVSRRRVLAWWTILDVAAGDLKRATARLEQAREGDVSAEDAGRLELASIAIAAAEGHRAEARHRLARLDLEADDRSVAAFVSAAVLEG